MAQQKGKIPSDAITMLHISQSHSSNPLMEICMSTSGWVTKSKKLTIACSICMILLSHQHLVCCRRIAEKMVLGILTFSNCSKNGVGNITKPKRKRQGTTDLTKKNYSY